MGSGSSTHEEAKLRQTTFIIGKLKNKSREEKQLYGLCSQIQINPKESQDNGKMKTSKGVYSEGQGHCERSMNNEREVTPSDCMTTELFTPLVIEKSLICTQTYTSWKARDDLYKMAQKLGFKKRVIYFVPIDTFPDFVSDFHMHSRANLHGYTLFSLIGEYLQIFYSGMCVKWLNPIHVTDKKWKIRGRKHKKTNKEQYLVSDFYRPLQKIIPHDGYCIMGITWTDLYPKEELNFVLGEANYQTQSGVMSFGRFEPKSFDPDKECDITEVTTELVWKLLKVSSHELGHLFGIEHCDFFRCLMNGSGSISEALNQPSFMCPVCIRKIQHVCGFNIVHRYRGLLRFFEDISEFLPSSRWTANIKWLKQVLLYLETDSDEDVNKT